VTTRLIARAPLDEIAAGTRIHRAEQQQAQNTTNRNQA
jgi:hypothetical protein